MDKSVVEEYQLYANRRYLTRIACKLHTWAYTLIGVDHEGLFWQCGFCGDRSYFSYAEYYDLEKKLALAKAVFNLG